MYNWTQFGWNEVFDNPLDIAVISSHWPLNYLYDIAPTEAAAEPNDGVADLNALRGKHNHRHVFSFKTH